jgi:hypothetical protein
MPAGVDLILASFLGTLLLYALQLHFGDTSAIRFIKLFAPNWESPLERVFEGLVFSLVGVAVAWVLVAPTTAQQAFSAGLGWMGLLTAIYRRPE